MTPATPIRIACDTIDRPALCLACELSANPWKLGFTTGAAPRPRERTVPARPIEAVPGREPQSSGALWAPRRRPRHPL